MSKFTELAAAVLEVACTHESSFDLVAYEKDVAANMRVSTKSYYKVTIKQAAAKLYPNDQYLQHTAALLLNIDWNSALNWAYQHCKYNKNSACTAKQTAV